MTTLQAISAPSRRNNDVYLFFVLACGVTWALDTRLDLAWATSSEPPAYALGLVGLGAWGPTIAASILAARRHQLRSMFGPWQTNPVWILVAPFVPLAVQLVATLIEVLLGGHPAHWFYPPARPEHFAALVMFSFGEEFGWRGFAYPRIEERHGPVVGSLILGAVWGLWHAGMMFAPDPPHAFNWPTLPIFIVTLALWSVVMAWFFEKSNRSIAVAIALHMGAHIDNVTRAPESEVRLRILRLAVLTVVAAFAARSLSANKVTLASSTATL
jgi:membrane protease YdiL (CAAX protease family)